MMVTGLSSGALLLVLLVGASYGYSLYRPDSSSGSKSKAPAPMSAPMGSGGVEPNAAPHGQPGYGQPSVGMELAAPEMAAPAKEEFAPAPAPAPAALAPASYGPEVSEYTGPHGSQSEQDFVWSVPHMFSYGALPGPEAAKLEPRPEAAKPEAARLGPLEPSNVSPPSYIRPHYQGGELVHEEATHEGGNFNMETEELHPMAPPELHPMAPPELQPMAPPELPSHDAKPASLMPPPPPPPPGRGWVFLPFPYDYRFLMGLYPPGTMSHFSSSFEQGRDNWHESHYIRDHYPIAEPVAQVMSQPEPSVVQNEPASSQKQDFGLQARSTRPAQQRQTNFRVPSNLRWASQP